MAGLLSDVLPFLYSQGDRLKRHAKGLLADPAGTMAQTAGLLGDKHREQQGLMAQAFGDKKAPFRVTDEGAMMQAAQAMLSGPLGMAPAGMFAGIGANTSNWDALQKAQKMLAAGDDPAKVWSQTGWGKGPDGHWRFEIDDSSATWNMEKGQKPISEIRAKLNHPDRFKPVEQQQVMAHDKLYDAYPDARTIEVDSRTSPMFGSGSFKELPGAWGKVSIDGPASAAGEIPLNAGRRNYLNTNLHELQHAIQQREGFARGGSPESVRPLLETYAEMKSKFDRAVEQLRTDADPIAKANALQEMQFYGSRLGKSANLKGATPDEAYRRLGGEAEARLTEARMNMTPQERAAQYPWQADYFQNATGVPLEQLIFRN